MPRHSLNIATREQKDDTGRYLLDHMVNIGEDTPEKNSQIIDAFNALTAQGYKWSSWSIDAAIRHHNHKLLDHLMNEIEHATAEFRVEHELGVKDLSHAAVHAHNVHALQYAVITDEHYEELARGDDTRFLGKLLAAYQDRHYHRTTALRRIWPAPTVRVTAFKPMLLDQYDMGFDGFRWLMRNGFIDGDQVDQEFRQLISARYGPAALKMLD